MPDQNDPNVNALQMAAQMQNFLVEAANYILETDKMCQNQSTESYEKGEIVEQPSKNLIEGAEMIKAFNE